MANPDYSYYAFNKAKDKHYAETLQSTMDSSLSDILRECFQETYYQPYPAFFAHAFQNTLKYEADARYIDYQKNPSHTAQRSTHGASHAMRVSVASVIFLGLYEKYGSDCVRHEINKLVQQMPGDDASKREYFTKLLCIAAAYHDAGRLGEGSDCPDWEARGGKDCEAVITQLLLKQEVEKEQAIIIAQAFSSAIVHKDAPLTKEKPILMSIIQCADCLDIIRCKTDFHLNYMDIWKDALFLVDERSHYIEREKRLELRIDLIELALEWRGFIAEQGDLEASAQIHISEYFKVANSTKEVKKWYTMGLESKRPNYTHDFETSVYSECEKTLEQGPFPKLQSLYYGAPKRITSSKEELEKLNAHIQNCHKKLSTLFHGEELNSFHTIIVKGRFALIHLKHEINQALCKKPDDKRALRLLKATNEYMDDFLNNTWDTDSYHKFTAAIEPYLNHRKAREYWAVSLMVMIATMTIALMMMTILIGSATAPVMPTILLTIAVFSSLAMIAGLFLSKIADDAKMSGSAEKLGTIATTPLLISFHRGMFQSKKEPSDQDQSSVQDNPELDPVSLQP